MSGVYTSGQSKTTGKKTYDQNKIETRSVTDRTTVNSRLHIRTASVTFDKLNNQTEIVVTFDPEEESPIEMQKGGWQSILDNFKKYVENN